MQHIYKCYVCHALQFTLYTLSMDLHRVPCVVFDQAAVSAQSDLAGATAPRRRNSTALWSLPAELAAVSTHKFLGYLHEIVSSEMRWLDDRRLDTSTSGTLSTRETTDQLGDDLHTIFQMCHVVLFVCEWAWEWFHHENKTVDDGSVDDIPGEVRPELLGLATDTVIGSLLVGHFNTPHVGIVVDDAHGAWHRHHLSPIPPLHCTIHRVAVGANDPDVTLVVPHCRHQVPRLTLDAGTARQTAWLLYDKWQSCSVRANGRTGIRLSHFEVAQQLDGREEVVEVEMSSLVLVHLRHDIVP